MADEMEDRLKSLDCAQVERFSFSGTCALARVTNVHDTDTITVVFIWNDIPVRTNVRLDGIDAPELNSRNELEVEACLKGTKILKDMIEDKIVRIELGKYDKYGRVLGRVYALYSPDEWSKSGCCVNEYLIKYQFVRPYSGGKKMTWSKEELMMMGVKRGTTEDFE